jgi:uncharacterized protein YndB with AHSA1/START domain
MFTINASTTIHASKERVFAALTRGLNSWWGRWFLETEESDQFNLELRLGGRFYAHSGHHDKEGSLLGIVIVLQEPDLIRFQGPFGMGAWGGQGTVEFTLAHTEVGTKLHVKHIAVGQFEPEVKQHYETGWHGLLHNLKELVEARKALGSYHDPALDIAHKDE